MHRDGLQRGYNASGIAHPFAVLEGIASGYG